MGLFLTNVDSITGRGTHLFADKTTFVLNSNRVHGVTTNDDTESAFFFQLNPINDRDGVVRIESQLSVSQVQEYCNTTPSNKFITLSVYEDGDYSNNPVDRTYKVEDLSFMYTTEHGTAVYLTQGPMLSRILIVQETLGQIISESGSDCVVQIVLSEEHVFQIYLAGSGTVTVDWNLGEVVSEITLTSSLVLYENPALGTVTITGADNLTSIYYADSTRVLETIVPSCASGITFNEWIGPIELDYVRAGENSFSVSLNGSGLVKLMWPDGTEEVAEMSDTGLYNGTAYTGTIEDGGTLRIYWQDEIYTLYSTSSYVTGATVPSTATDIRDITVANASLTTFTTHSEWVNLKRLSLYWTNLTALLTYSEWVNLESVYINNTNTASFNTHPEWVNLKSLYLHSTNLNSLTTHEEWVAFETLYIWDTTISSLTTYPTWNFKRLFGFGTCTEIETHEEWVNMDWITAPTNGTLESIETHSTWTAFTELAIINHPLTNSTIVDNILVELDNTGAVDQMEVALYGALTPIPSPVGCAAASRLRARGNVVTTNACVTTTTTSSTSSSSTSTTSTSSTSTTTEFPGPTILDAYVTSAAGRPDLVWIEFSEQMDTDTATADYFVVRADGGPNISLGSGYGSADDILIAFNMARDIVFGEVITVSYTPDGGPDAWYSLATGIELPQYVDYPVRNLVAATTTSTSSTSTSSTSSSTSTSSTSTTSTSSTSTSSTSTTSTTTLIAESEYAIIYDAMVEPPDPEIADAQEAFVEDLIDAGVWEKCDLLYVFEQQYNDNGEALINWVNPGNFDATESGTLTWTSFEGYQGSGLIGQVLATGYTPSIHADNYIQDSASFGFYSRSDIIESRADMGTSGSPGAIIFSRQTSVVSALRLNSSVTNGVTGPGTSIGMFIGNRILSTHMEFWHNGVRISNICFRGPAILPINKTALYGLRWWRSHIRSDSCVRYSMEHI